MGPSTSEHHLATDSIILGVNVEESVCGHVASCWVAANGTDIVHPETSTVVALVCKSVDDVQVVIYSFVVDGEEGSRCLWVAEITHVDDVGDGTSRRRRSLSALLVKLIVEDHKLVALVGPPALVAVCRARVRKSAQNLRCGVALLAGGVVDGDGVFVVADADVAATEAAVWTFIVHTLSIVDVAVGRSAAGRLGVGGVGKINVLKTTSAAGVTGLSANSDGVSGGNVRRAHVS